MSHLSNISIPARFSFRPYEAHWDICWAEIIDWIEPPETASFLFPLPPPRGRDRLLVRVDTQPASLSRMLLMGLDRTFDSGSYTVEIDRADVPIDVLPSHENRQNTPDIS